MKVVNYTSDTTDSDTSHFGYPYGSVLGPFLFTLYIYPLSQFLTKSNLSFQGYSPYKAFYVVHNMTNIELHISQVQVWMIKKQMGKTVESEHHFFFTKFIDI